MTTNLRSFDRVAHVYDATRSAPPHVANAVTEALLILLRDVAPSPHLLEVGIGTGRIAVPLAGANVRVTGIDISSKMLDVLRGKRRDIDVLFAEAAHAPFRDAAFDAALFVHILHLVPDIEGTIRETVRAVRPGGALVHVSDDHEEGGYHLEAGRIMWDVVEELTGATRPRDQHADALVRFDEILRASEARIEERFVVRYEDPFNARHAMARLRSRDFSSSWLIPDAAFDDVTAATERRYEEHWGDLDIVHPAQRTTRLVIARRP